MNSTLGETVALLERHLDLLTAGERLAFRTVFTTEETTEVWWRSQVQALADIVAERILAGISPEQIRRFDPIRFAAFPPSAITAMAGHATED